MITTGRILFILWGDDLLGNRNVNLCLDVNDQACAYFFAQLFIWYFPDKENVSVNALKSESRRRKITIVRSQLAKELVEEWGLSLTETSRHLGVSPSAIAKTLYRLDKHKPS